MAKINKSKLIKIIRERLFESWRNNLVRKDLRKILHINHVSGFTTDQLRDHGKKDAIAVYNYIHKKMPWFMNYGHYDQSSGQWQSPLQGYFDANAETDLFLDWSSNLLSTLAHLQREFSYWTAYPDLHGPDNVLWKKRQAGELEILKQHPEFNRDLKGLIDYIQELRNRSPDNSTFQGHYPLFVTLYNHSREYGGPEEGGWWYDDNKPVKTIQVNSYKEARAVAVVLLKQMYNLSDHPVIYLEKIYGANERTDMPRFS